MQQCDKAKLPHRSSSSPRRCRDGCAKVSGRLTLFCNISPVPWVTEYKWGGYRSFVQSRRLYIRRTWGTLCHRYGPDRTWGWEMACRSSPATLTDGHLLNAPDQGELTSTIFSRLHMTTLFKKKRCLTILVTQRTIQNQRFSQTISRHFSQMKVWEHKMHSI